MTVPGTVDGEIQQVTGTWYWYHTGTRIPHMDSRYKILRLSESRWNRGVEYQVPGTVSICVPWYCTWCNIIILLPLLFRRSWQELLRNKKLPTGKNPSGIFFFFTKAKTKNRAKIDLTAREWSTETSERESESTKSCYHQIRDTPNLEFKHPSALTYTLMADS